MFKTVQLLGISQFPWEVCGNVFSLGYNLGRSLEVPCGTNNHNTLKLFSFLSQCQMAISKCCIWILHRVWALLTSEMSNPGENFMTLFEPNWCHRLGSMSNALENNRVAASFMHLKLRREQIPWRWEEAMWGSDYGRLKIICSLEG